MGRSIDVLLVDDEHLALDLLENFSSRIPYLRTLGRVTSGTKAIEFLAAQPVDLLVLDIQMPQLSGTSLLSVLKNPPLAIFTTAYAEYAVDAFALDAVDYLLKPFGFERFFQAIEKVKARMPENGPPAQETIAFRADGGLHRIPIAEILFVEGMKEYVRITTSTKRFTAYLRLHQLEAQLPPNDFLKVHRSYTVNVRHVESLLGNRLLLAGHEVPVSRDLKAMVLERLFPQ